MVENQGMDTLDDLHNEKDWQKTFDLENQGRDTLDDLPNEIDWPKIFVVENQGKDTLDLPKTIDRIDEFFHKHYKSMVENQGKNIVDYLPNEIERAPHTLTEANDSIIKHHSFVTDN